MSVVSLDMLWTVMFKGMSDKAFNLLLPFATSANQLFLAITAIKTGYRSRLNIEADVCICLLHIIPVRM